MTSTIVTPRPCCTLPPIFSYFSLGPMKFIVAVVVVSSLLLCDGVFFKASFFFPMAKVLERAGLILRRHTGHRRIALLGVRSTFFVCSVRIDSAHERSRIHRGEDSQANGKPRAIGLGGKRAHEQWHVRGVGVRGR
ncbi:unnamed protein product, partial [Ectocarpus sp. 12 AP-2014]